MKTITFIIVILTALCSQTPQAQAHTYSFQPNPVDLYDLDHWRYYTWGIEIPTPFSGTIVEAFLHLDNIRNWNNRSNDLWIQLLDTVDEGVTVGRDNQWWSENYFGDEGIPLEHYRNLTTTPVDKTYDFDDSQLTTLSSYLEDENFGLGFDPDCHYWNDGVTLTIITNPIPPALILFPTGLAALAVFFRRKKR